MTHKSNKNVLRRQKQKVCLKKYKARMKKKIGKSIEYEKLRYQVMIKFFAEIIFTKPHHSLLNVMVEPEQESWQVGDYLKALRLPHFMLK